MMVTAYYVIVTMGGNIPEPEGAAVLMRGDNLLAVQLMTECRRGGVRTGTMMILGAMKVNGGWCFQAEHVKWVDSRSADGVTRWKREDAQSSRTRESSRIV